MEKILSPKPLDLGAYAADAPVSDAYYGLPQEIVFCKKCAYSNQKPNSASEFKHNKDTKKDTVSFDENGVCNACRAVEKKQAINWQDREAELRELCDQYRKNDGTYDCLVPGSGGKDSVFAAHKLKHEFGMNPLTVTWAPHMYTDWGWQNFQSWIHSGFDNYLFTPNGLAHRLLTRLAVEQIFHPFQPFMMGQMCFPPKLAAKFNIPLVFYGENPAEYGNAGEGNETASKEQRFFATDDRENLEIAGVSIADLKSDFGLTDLDLAPYLPARSSELGDHKIDVQYLGYYLRWHPQDNYYYSVEHADFKAAPERTAGTYSKYSSIDDKIDDFHYYTTFIKFGIGRATYDAAQEARSGDITREEALALVRRYDGEFPTRFENEIYEYLSLPEEKFPVASKMFEQPIMDRDYFLGLCDKFRSPHLWENTDNQWKLRRTVWQEN
jgi:N-acetyl sugar amidotransferase